MGSIFICMYIAAIVLLLLHIHLTRYIPVFLIHLHLCYKMILVWLTQTTIQGLQ